MGGMEAGKMTLTIRVRLSGGFYDFPLDEWNAEPDFDENRVTIRHRTSGGALTFEFRRMRVRKIDEGLVEFGEEEEG